jgi:hypothetical protein
VCSSVCESAECLEGFLWVTGHACATACMYFALQYLLKLQIDCS